jgi:predicted nuclease with TOPRIM domain
MCKCEDEYLVTSSSERSGEYREVRKRLNVECLMLNEEFTQKTQNNTDCKCRPKRLYVQMCKCEDEYLVTSSSERSGEYREVRKRLSDEC